MTPRLYRLLVAAVLVVTPVAVMDQPAAADSRRCPAGTGVTVVVDYGALGGGVQIACDRGGAGDPVSEVSPRTGYPLSYVTNEPGFVCAVASKPDPQASCGRTPPSNAYWGLFWSDGTPASWTYSSEGARSLRVPAGGSIGWRWQDGDELDRPGAAPTPRPAKAQASPKPSPKPSPAESGQSGSSGAASPTTAARSSAPQSASASASANAERSPASGDGAKRAAADKGKEKDKDSDRERRRKDSAPRDRSPEPDASTVTDAAAEPVEEVEPLSAAGDDTGSAGGLLPLLVGGLAVVGLGTYAAVAARRRRV